MAFCSMISLTNRKSVSDAEGKPTSISLNPASTRAVNIFHFRSGFMGSMRAWLPSRRSTEHHRGAPVSTASGQVRSISLTGSNAWYLWIGIPDGCWGCNPVFMKWPRLELTHEKTPCPCGFRGSGRAPLGARPTRAAGGCGCGSSGQSYAEARGFTKHADAANRLGPGPSSGPSALRRWPLALRPRPWAPAGRWRSPWRPLPHWMTDPRPCRRC